MAERCTAQATHSLALIRLDMPTQVASWDAERRARRALGQAHAYGRAWHWEQAGAALRRAYLALGAVPEYGDLEAGQLWHRGSHPLQVELDRLERAEEAAQRICSAEQVVVVRQDGPRYTVSLGMGSTTLQLRGSYRTPEEAREAGLAASAERYAETVADIDEDVRVRAAPHAPQVLYAEHGVSAWDAVPQGEVAHG